MGVDIGILAAVLSWLVAGPGAGALAFYVLERLPRFQAMQPEYKRYVSLTATAILAMAAFTAAVGLGYHAAPSGRDAEPADVQGWLEALFAVAFVATGLGQIIHGKVVLGKR